MDVAYAQITDCVDVIPSLADITDISARLEASLFQSLLDASRTIETDLQVPVNYFKPADVDSSLKIIYTSDTDFIRLPPYTDTLESVTDNDDAVIDSEIYLANEYIPFDPRSYYLKWLYSGCGTRRWTMPLKITARWGYPCVPPDIKLAVKSMGCLLFLTNPPTRNGQVTGLDETLATRLRGSYNKVLNAWMDKFHHRQLGIG